MMYVKIPLDGYQKFLYLPLTAASVGTLYDSVVVQQTGWDYENCGIKYCAKKWETVDRLPEERKQVVAPPEAPAQATDADDAQQQGL